MGRATKHTWKCDGCDDISTHTGDGLPMDWVEFLLSVRSGPAIDGRPFTVCRPCFNFMFENRRKGNSWRERIKKLFGVAP